MKDELINELPESCSYCGNKIDSRLYFCPRCAKPYRTVEALLPASAKPYSDIETQLRSAKDAWNVFFIYMIILIVIGSLGIAIWGKDNMEAVLLVADGAIAVTTVAFMVRFWSDLKPQFARIQRLFHPWSLGGLAILAPLLWLNYGYHGMLTEWAGVETEDYQAYFSSSWGPILFICVMPALTEEIAYRGIIQHQFERVVSTRVALVMASVIFSAAHLSVLSAPYLALLGLLLGWMKLKTKSLYPPMVAHFLHNYVVITYF